MSHSAEKIRKGTLRCFKKKFRVSKKFMHERGISRFSVEIFSSHSTEKLRRGNLLCFRKILVSRNVRDKKGDITIFHRNCSTEKFMKKPSGFEEILASKNFMDMRG